jgi:hypothetical protein
MLFVVIEAIDLLRRQCELAATVIGVSSQQIHIRERASGARPLGERR